MRMRVVEQQHALVHQLANGCGRIAYLHAIGAVNKNPARCELDVLRRGFVQESARVHAVTEVVSSTTAWRRCLPNTLYSADVSAAKATKTNITNLWVDNYGVRATLQSHVGDILDLDVIHDHIVTSNIADQHQYIHKANNIHPGAMNAKDLNGNARIQVRYLLLDLKTPSVPVTAACGGLCLAIILLDVDRHGPTFMNVCSGVATKCVNHAPPGVSESSR